MAPTMQVEVVPGTVEFQAPPAPFTGYMRLNASDEVLMGKVKRAMSRCLAPPGLSPTLNGLRTRVLQLRDQVNSEVGVGIGAVDRVRVNARESGTLLSWADEIRERGARGLDMARLREMAQLWEQLETEAVRWAQERRSWQEGEQTGMLGAELGALVAERPTAVECTSGTIVRLWVRLRPLVVESEGHTLVYPELLLGIATEGGLRVRFGNGCPTVHSARDGWPWHPHVRSEGICLGEARELVPANLGSGCLTGAVMAVESVLGTYNPGSPFIRIGDLGNSLANLGSSWCRRCNAWHRGPEYQRPGGTRDAAQLWASGSGNRAVVACRECGYTTCFLPGQSEGHLAVRTTEGLDSLGWADRSCPKCGRDSLLVHRSEGSLRSEDATWAWWKRQEWDREVI